MTARDLVAEKFVSDEITKALERTCLPHDHTIRVVLEREAEIEKGVRDVFVRCHGQSLDQRIESLRHDPSYAASFPHPEGKVAKGDMATMRTQFAKIADGSVVVE